MHKDAYNVLSGLWKSADLIFNDRGQDSWPASYLHKNRGIGEVPLYRCVRKVKRRQLVYFIDWARRHFSPEAIVQSGLTTYLTRPDYVTSSSFATQIFVFPYYDSEKNISTLRFREPGDGAQVQSLRSPRLKWKGDYPPHRPELPFAYHRADALYRKLEGPLIVCEGEIDCLSAWTSCSASIGTVSCSTFKPQWCNIFEHKRVVVLGDGDRGGRRLCETVKSSVKEALDENIIDRRCIDIEFLQCPDGKDLNDMLRSSTLSKYLDSLGRKVSA